MPFPAFGQTFLLQYKVARRTTAKAGANAKFWDVYDNEYYRFSLIGTDTGATRSISCYLTLLPLALSRFTAPR